MAIFCKKHILKLSNIDLIKKVFDKKFDSNFENDQVDQTKRKQIERLPLKTIGIELLKAYLKSIRSKLELK